MSKLNTAIDLIRRDRKRFKISLLKNLNFFFNDKTYLRLLFKLSLGYDLDFDHPQTFNEKLQWLKINCKHEEYTTLVDKVAVKDYVENKIGSSYVIPTIGVWDSLDDVKLESLPKQFVLKNAGDSGGIIICKDKNSLDFNAAKRNLNSLSAYKFYRLTKEYPYKNIPRRYIAEAYLVDESGYELKDYKFFCFNGKPQYVQVDFDRFKEHKRNIYDMQWNFINLQIEYPNDPNKVIDKPLNFEKMKEVAGALSEGIPHVRVDLYNVNGHIYFGELTFFHGSGFEHFEPIEWDKIFGDLINLPQK